MYIKLLIKKTINWGSDNRMESFQKRHVYVWFMWGPRRMVPNVVSQILETVSMFSMYVLLDIKLFNVKLSQKSIAIGLEISHRS